MNEHIYALFYYVDGTKRYFYVGRSGREPQKRLYEHSRAAKSRHEDVYVFIRENNIMFEQEILTECTEYEPNDYEDFYVQKLIVEGHELKNMKSGDARRAAQGLSVDDIKNLKVTISSVKECREYKERVKYEKSEALRQKKLAKHLQRLAKLEERERQRFLATESKRIKQEARIKQLKDKIHLNDMRGYKQSSNRAAQEAFDKGKYSSALNQLGGSYMRFQEEFGIDYMDCLK